MPCDYSKYPPNWFTEIRPRILERAGNRCEHKNCGLKNHSMVYSVKLKGIGRRWFTNLEIPQGDPYFSSKQIKGTEKLVKVVLTIAHLDHDRDNHEVKDERLRAYCQLHHLAHDQSFKVLNMIKNMKPLRILKSKKHGLRR